MNFDRHHTSKLILFLAGCVIIIIAGVKWSLHLESHMDLVYGDEVEYLRNGVDLFHIVRSDWGPSYNIWYKFLSCFAHDPITLYYLNFKLTGILTALSLFAFLYVYHFNILVSLVLALVFFASELNLNNWPRVSHFVITLMFIAFILMKFAKSNTARAIIFSIFIYIVSFTRPEVYLVFIISIIIIIYFLWREKTERKRAIPLLVILAAFFVFFQSFFGFPSKQWKGEDRKFSAFRQHYAINYKLRTNADFDPVIEWMDFTKKTFKGCDDMSCVVKKYPALLIQNTIFNIKLTFAIWLDTINNCVFPNAIFHKNKLKLIFLALFFAAFLYLLIKRSTREKLRERFHENRQVLLYAGLFALPSVASCFIIHPRLHYVMMHIPFIEILLAIILSTLTERLKFKSGFAVLFGLAFLVVAPKANSYKYFQLNSDMKNLCQQKTMRFLMDDAQHPHVVFSNYLNITYLLPKNYTEFNVEYDYKPGMQFLSVVDSCHIDMVTMNSSILQNKLLQQDSTWNRFVAAPEKYNFHKAKYSDLCEGYLLVKDSKRHE